jgi:hypothetical protein
MDEPTDRWRPLAGVAIDVYEASVRASTDVQRRIAATVGVEPIHSIATASADYTRDVGAVVASRARWLLDV